MEATWKAVLLDALGVGVGSSHNLESRTRALTLTGNASMVVCAAAMLAALGWKQAFMQVAGSRHG